jgi:hypothetical protein
MSRRSASRRSWSDRQIRLVGRDETARLLQFDVLTAALRKGFAQGAEVPIRHHHAAGAPGTDATLLLMPA